MKIPVSINVDEFTRRMAKSLDPPMIYTVDPAPAVLSNE